MITTKPRKRCRMQKVIFHTELDAKIALATRMAKDKGEIDYYQCELKGHWHLTSQEERGNRHGHAAHVQR